MRSRRRIRGRWGAAACAWLVVACSSPSAEAPRFADPPPELVERFATFDDWARRSLDGDHLFPSEAAFRESLFAPLRSEEDVRDACVEVRAATVRTACLRGDAPARVDDTWAVVAGARLPGIRALAGDGTVVLARSARRGVVDVRVTMTFETR